MLVTPSMFTVSHTSGGGSGNAFSLTYNKYFDTDDRTSDGWSVSEDNALYPSIISGSCLVSGLPTGTSLIKETLTTLGIGTKIRARVKQPYEAGGYSIGSFSLRLYKKSDPTKFLRISVTNNTYSPVNVIGFDQNGIGVGGGWSSFTYGSVNTFFGVQITVLDPVSFRMSMVDDSGTEVSGVTVGTGMGYDSFKVYQNVDTFIAGNEFYRYIDQISYDLV
jgi:hypothetical protein